MPFAIPVAIGIWTFGQSRGNYSISKPSNAGVCVADDEILRHQFLYSRAPPLFLPNATLYHFATDDNCLQQIFCPASSCSNTQLPTSGFHPVRSCPCNLPIVALPMT